MEEYREVKEEVWRPVVGYEGLYEVSNLGRVKTVRLLTPCKDAYGYPLVGLTKDGQLRSLRVHRLVAEAFIPNPHNLPMVNHKDEDKGNSHVDNLEWCTHAYNCAYGTRNLRCGPKARRVVQLSESGEFIKEWGSQREAAEALGAARTAIGAVANHRKQGHKERDGGAKKYTLKTCCGFKWVWADEYYKNR